MARRPCQRASYAKQEVPRWRSNPTSATDRLAGARGAGIRSAAWRLRRTPPWGQRGHLRQRTRYRRGAGRLLAVERALDVDGGACHIPQRASQLLGDHPTIAAREVAVWGFRLLGQWISHVSE